MNYYDQLCKMYPDKKDILWYMQYAFHHHLYAYGSHSNISWETRSGSLLIKCIYWRLKTTLLRSNHKNICYNKVQDKKCVVSSTDTYVNKSLEREGFCVIDLYRSISFKSFVFLNSLMDSHFNVYFTSSFEKKVIRVRQELKDYFSKRNVVFLLLANDVVPLSRLAIGVCKEMNIPTGVFLHGLPASYDLIDNFYVDYTFVWGESIKENYKSIGCKKNIIVTGNPKYSGVKELSGSHDNVVVVSFCAGDVYDGSDNYLADRGLCVQYVYSVQSVLLRIGVRHAILRVHPHENRDWYRKFVDTDFYILDENSLEETLSLASYIIGPVSSVLVDAVSHRIPYYPYIITQDVNPHSWKQYPPFREKDGLPVARSVEQLTTNLKEKKHVMLESILSYISEKYDVEKIIRTFI